MIKNIVVVFLFFTISFFSCGEDEVIIDPTNNNPNILLIIADDMGLDASPGYDLGTIKPNMPNLQGFIESGLTFNNLWSNPTCTPTRSSIITGKYGFRTGVTMVGHELSTSETSLQTYLKQKATSNYTTAVVGKWHLSNDANHPPNMGVDYYAGLLTGGVQSYNNWNFSENGQTNNTTEYSTSKITDVAIEWLKSQDQPWFLWLAYNAPHSPFHLPPNNLHFQENLPGDEASIEADPIPYYMAMLEAMDTELGRLLESLPQQELENTTIIFIGDNGTPNQTAQEYNNRRVKGTVYQGGVNVPMIISGKGVDRINQKEDALINTTDLFTTIAQLAGSSESNIHDSQSFLEMLQTPNLSTRNYTYAEIGTEIGGTNYTIRNQTHKYILFEDGSEALYNLLNNPLENPNLLNPNQLPLTTSDSEILDNLKNELESLRE